MSPRKPSLSQNPDAQTLQVIDDGFHDIVNLILHARRKVATFVDDTMVETYWQIGKRIVEIEQGGEERARYGEFVIQRYSEGLNQQFGSGFSSTVLKRIRKFYLVYPKGAEGRHLFALGEEDKHKKGARDGHLLGEGTGENEKGADPRHLLPKWPLRWSHYRELIALEPLRRQFYEIEAQKNNWSGVELERQIDTFLFERLAKSKDKAGLLALIQQGQTIRTPEDTFKDPFVFEFLNIPNPKRIKESQLEAALLNDLQHFFLEFGKGIAFIGQQQRITIDNTHYYVDLVFYHVILKCYLLVDLKINPLTHADLGQMQVYVNYYDMECKQPEDNPTIGLILCPRSKEKLVRYFIGNNPQQVYSRQYQLYLPTEEQLSEELQRDLFHLKQQLEDK